MRKNSSLQKQLAQNVAGILRQGVALLKEIDDGFYCRSEKSAATHGGTVGAHFRHCLEFINCFLRGIENGRVDYNDRTRNQRLETNREYAIGEFIKTTEILENFVPFDAERALPVKSENFTGDDEDGWCASSIERELDFLQSHTIHHFALIGFKLRAYGVELPADFGVAPSTLQFWNERKRSAAQ